MNRSDYDAPDTEARNRLLDAALLHVPFDGWGEATFLAAIRDSGLADTLARAICPRGAVDLALAFHDRGDAAMLARISEADFSGLKFREKIMAAVRFRLEEVSDKETVRRGTTLFALPQHVADGAKAIWGTCDLIWTALGDTSEDVNWYTKRASLSAVYTSTVLYWLGDSSPGHQETWSFLERRINNVMQFEKLKAQLRNNQALKPFLAGPNWLIGQIKAPGKAAQDLPGTLAPRR
jgi:ubiquinone biosynthesis protein COQ9